MANQSLSAESEDPWDWPIDQVVKEFCRSASNRPGWCSKTDRLPDPTLLESEIRNNDITGEVLLTTVTKDVLQRELSIRSMGQRHAVEKGIDYLRARSRKYGASSPKVAMAPPNTPMYSWLQNSGPPYESPPYMGVGAPSAVQRDQSHDSSRFDIEFKKSGGLHIDIPHKINLAQPQAASGIPTRRAAANTSTDGHLIFGPHSNFNEVPMKVEDELPCPKRLRRIAPTFMAHLDEKPGRSLPTPVKDSGDVAFRAADKSDSGEREFTMLGASVSNGERLLASRTLKKYLQRLEVSSVSSDGKNEVPADHGLHNLEDVDFRYLLSKYPPKAEGEDALEPYGDSGDEGDFDDETWQEIQKDAAEGGNREVLDRMLTPSHVTRVIDEAIQNIKDTWTAKKLPKVQAKGFRLWKRARQQGRVEIEIGNAQYWIRHLRESMAKIRQALTREAWSSESSLRRQCQSLEESVAQQDEHQYNVSILNSHTVPPRPERRTVQREKYTPISMSDGEIFLDSESDLSVGNFIDDNDESQLNAMAVQQNFGSPQYLGPNLIDGDNSIAPGSRSQQPEPITTPIPLSKEHFLDAKPPSSVEAEADAVRLLRASIYSRRGHEKETPIELISSSEPSTPVKAGINSARQVQRESKKSLPSTPQRLKLSQPKLPASAASLIFSEVGEIGQTPSRSASSEKYDHQGLWDHVSELSGSKRCRILEFLRSRPKESLHEVLRDEFAPFFDRHRGGEASSKNDWEPARLVAVLFMSYITETVWNDPYSDKQAIKRAESLVDSTWRLFFDCLQQALEKDERKPNDATSRGDTASDSDPPIPQQTAGRKRRRVVWQNPTTISSQQQAKRRKREDEERRSNMFQQYQKIPPNRMDPASHSIGVEKPVVYLDPKIGEKVKAHQLDGIRFMWRELTTDENKQGCLLAHTMGLGKTMQVVSLLATITNSTKSDDPLIRRQIPPDLCTLKALILCPPSLIDNWVEEIELWRPDPTVFGKLYMITQRLEKLERLREIDQWATYGGILIISYDMFRGLIVNKPQADLRPLNEKDHARIQDQLLKLPNIIIADEAHKMKNTESSISMVTSKFRSSRRIALTGSPLANNLDEYFAMIDWIAPGYLGTREEFRSKYAIPIAEGLWNDSESYDRRISLRKLHVLKENLDPKISRAGIAAIADDLPPKTEFFMSIVLTEKQIRAYDLYIGAILGDPEGQKTGNARLWDWLAILSLLCNHPSTFLRKLDDREYCFENKIKQVRRRALGLPERTTDDVEAAGPSLDVESANAGLTLEMIEKQREIFQTEEDSGESELPSLSHRSQIVFDIVNAARRAGDKVLVFSHSIPTLDYLQGAIVADGHSTCRIDGSVKVTSRQEAVKNFNKDTSEYDVFMISTRAGGLGLNLQGANRVILFDYGFNPVWEEQAIGRAYRLGQKKPVFVYRLRSAGTFEELIYNKAVFKSQLSARVVDKKTPMRHASRKVTDYLFPVRTVPQSDLSPFVGKDPCVLDQILPKSKGIRDIILTETFQEEENEPLTAEEVKQASDELKDEQEKRRMPAVHPRLQTPRQNVNANTARASIPSLGLKRPVAHQRNTRIPPSGPPVGERPIARSRQPTNTTTFPKSARRSISRPEASGSPQQMENVIWDQPPNRHSLNRVGNVLGATPFHNTQALRFPTTITTTPRSPSSPPPLPRPFQTPQRAAVLQSTNSSSAARPGVDGRHPGQLDGAADDRDDVDDGDDEDDDDDDDDDATNDEEANHDPRLAGCKTQ